MFGGLGNLSHVSEQNTRKKNKKKKSKGLSSDDVTLDGEDEGLPRRARKATQEVIYTAELDNVTREVLIDYLVNCKKMILRRSSIEEIVEDSKTGGIGLQVAAINYQRDVLENNFRIERNYGCKALSMITQVHRDDAELVEAARDFMFVAMKSYLMALDVRKEQNPSYSREKMTRAQILEFFEACNARMAMEDTKKELKEIWIRDQLPPNARIIAMQRELLDKLGFDPDFGVACLNRVGQDFAGDSEVTTKMQYFACCASVTCQIACFDEAETKEFFDKIPPMMHSFPHVWVMQNEMALRRRQAENITSSSGSSNSNDATALRASGLLLMLSTPDGREKVQLLGARIQEHKEAAEADVTTWDKEKKFLFFQEFCEHPVVTSLSEAKEPIEKINTFINMSDGDISSLVTLMAVIGSEDGQAIMNEMRNAAAAAATTAATDATAAATITTSTTASPEGAGKNVNMMEVMTNIASVMGPLSNLKFAARSQSATQGFSHAQSSGGHGECCGVKSNIPDDVSTGVAAKMDR